MKLSQSALSNRLTSGPILGSLLWFAFPMIAGNILQQIYNIVDTLIVGRYIGTDALAAVGASYTLMVFLTSMIIGLCMGSGALWGISYGQKNLLRLKRDFFLSVLFIGGTSFAITAIVYIWTDPILRLLRIPPGVYGPCYTYVRIIFLGILFIALYNVYAFALGAMGDSKTPVYFLAVSSLLNIALDVSAVVVLGKGIAGVAWATVISQAAAGIGLKLYCLIKVPELRIKGTDMRIDWPRLKQIIVNDFYTGMQQSVMNFGILMIQGLVNTFGPVVMAAFAVAVKIDTLAYMPTQEFGNAFSLFISQNHGAGESGRVRAGTKVAVLTAFVFSLIVSVFVFVFASDLMRIFVNSSEVGIIAEGVKYLRIEGATYIGIGILFLWYGYFRGIGRGELSLVLTVVSLGTRVALSYALAPHTALGVIAIWAAIPIGWLLADITGWWLWKKRSLE